MALLTIARESLWRAIDNDGALNQGPYKLARKYKGNDFGALQTWPPRPSIGELPSLGLWPAAGQDNWWTNQQRKSDYYLLAELWTANADLRQAEDLWEKVIRALWKNRPSATEPEYWRGPTTSATANMRMEGLSITPQELEPGNVESPLATQTQWLVILELNWNPRL